MRAREPLEGIRMRAFTKLLTFLSASVLALMVACGGSSGSAPAVVPEPTITGFTADKTAIAQGEVAYLTAVYTNGTGTLSPGGGAIPSGQAIAVQPLQTTTYILTVANSLNATATRALTVTVAPPIANVSLTASKTSIVVGESVQLTATFSNGTAAVTNNVNATSITPVSGVPFTVSPASTTVYTLTVTNTAGAKVTQGVIINVQNTASITSFTANPPIITQGATATLNYSFSGGTGVINNGVGPVASGLATAVTPQVTTTYLLTVSNSSGSTAVSAVTVTVAGMPSNVTLVPDRTTLTVGESARLTPSFTGGTAVISNTLDGSTIIPVSGVPVTVTPSENVTYILTVTNTAGLATTAAATLTVIPLPEILNFWCDPGTITRGSSADLVPTFRYGTATISNGVGAVQNGVRVPVSPTQTTPYTLTVTNATGAFVQKSIILNVVDPPTGISLVALPPIITIGNSTRLVGNFASGTAQVDNGVGTVMNGVPYLVTPAVTTTYTMTVINPAGAAATTGTVVTVVPPPAITAFTSNPPTPPPVAGGSPVQLLPVFTNGSGYISGVGSVVSGNSYTVNPIETTTYTLTVTNPAGDAVTRILTVHVVGDPQIQSFTAYPSTITAGDFSQLIGIFSGGNGVVTGAGLPVGGVPITSGVSLFVNPAVTTTYTLTVTNSAMVSVNRSVTVLVVGAPSGLTLTSTVNPITEGDTTYLQPTWITAIGGTTGQLTPDVGAVITGASYAVQPAKTTTYTLTVQNSIGAASSVVHTVVVLTGPNAAALVAKPEGITLGGTAYLTAYFKAGTGGTAAVQCTSANAATSGLAAALNPNNAVPFAVTPSAAGTYVYTLTVTNSAGVTSTHGATITVYGVPTAGLAVTAGSSNPITQSETTSITPTFTNGTGVIAGIGPVTSGQAYPVSPTATTTYVLTVTNPVGQTATASLTVVVLTGPNAAALSSKPEKITLGSSTYLTAFFSVGAGGTAVVDGPATSFTPAELPASFPGPGTLLNAVPFQVTPTAAGTHVYTLTVTNSGGQTSTYGTTVTVYDVPTASLAVTANPIILGGTTTITPTFTNGKGVIEGIGAVTSGQAYPVSPTVTTTYVLTVTNPVGDAASASVTVTVLAGPLASSFAFQPALITEGDSTYLKAIFSNATSASVTHNAPVGVTPASPIAAVTSGTPITVTAGAGTAGVYTYTLTVTNAAATPAITYTTTTNLTVVPAATATLNVSSPAGPPYTISAGQSATLSPVFTNGTGVISGGVGPVISGVSYVVTPTVSTTYTLTVTNAAGQEVTDTQTIFVVAGPFAQALTANPLVITVGDPTYLTGVFNPIGATALVDSGSAGSGLPGPGITPFNGVPLEVTPTTTGMKIYYMTVTNGILTHITGVAVNVVAAPTASMTPLGTSDPLYFPGDNITWTITYTDGGANTNGVFTDVLQGASSTVASGQTVVTSIPFMLPAGTVLTYTLKVTNAAGSSIVVPVSITLS